MPMTMYEIAFPVTINIGAWAVVYVRQIGQIDSVVKLCLPTKICI